MKTFIETDRLILRPIQLADAEDVFEYAKDLETGPRAGWPPHKSIKETKSLLEKWVKPGYKEKTFAVVYKPDNKVIGTMGIESNPKNKKNDYAWNLMQQNKKLFEIGNVIAKKYWGLGISTECLKAMINYLFEEYEADIIVTSHARPNVASGRVQEKCGMKEVYHFDTDEPWYNTDDKYHIVRIKTRQDWERENAQETINQ